MKIYLMQHGQNFPEAVDPDQGLSPVGREEVETSARAASRMGIAFSDIFASPKKRSQQTARIMARGTDFPEDDVIIHEDFKAMVAPDRTVRNLLGAGCGNSVLICGHLPSLSRIACSLLSSGPEFTIGITNAGLMCISMERLPTSSAKLEWHLRPEHLHELAG